MTTDAPAKTMTATDRRQISKIVDQRFDLLKRQVSDRMTDAEDEAERQIMAEHDQAIKTHKNLVAKLRKRADKLAEDAREVLEHARAAGLRLDGYRTTKLFDYSIEDDFVPTNLRDQVRERTSTLRAAQRKGLLHLDEMRAELLTDVAVGGLQTDEARTFLSRIPTAETLLSAGQSKQLGS